jgi:hypothetical protein
MAKKLSPFDQIIVITYLCILYVISYLWDVLRTLLPLVAVIAIGFLIYRGILSLI